jgi:ribosome-associated heat shock protein Hsp15
LAGKGGRTDSDAAATLRLDKWLHQARFFRTRALAAAEIEGPGIRINGQKTHKPGHVLRVGDTLTFRQAQTIRLIRVAALSQRRGPATEAQQLYVDLDAPPPLE